MAYMILRRLQKYHAFGYIYDDVFIICVRNEYFSNQGDNSAAVDIMHFMTTNLVSAPLYIPLIIIPDFLYDI